MNGPSSRQKYTWQSLNNDMYIAELKDPVIYSSPFAGKM